MIVSGNKAEKLNVNLIANNYNENVLRITWKVKHAA